MLITSGSGSPARKRDELFVFVDADGSTWQMTAAGRHAAGMTLVSPEPIVMAPTRGAPSHTISGAEPARQIATMGESRTE